MTVEHRCLPAPSARGEPDHPRWEVADVVRLYGATYLQTHPVSPTQQKVLEAIAACRTAQLGGHAEQCPQCGFERYAYHSCRNRHCPKCQTLPTAQWVEERQAELLPVPYFHTVFTLPHDLNPLLVGNKRLLVPLLFAAASQTLRQFGQQNLGGQLGSIMVLHTWDQCLNAHFHVHCLVPGGALVDAGTRWVPTHPRFLFPVQALGTVFRAKFLDLLRQPRTAEALHGPETSPALRTPTDFQRLLHQLYAKAWIVYAKPPFAGPTQVVDYLGHYTHRVAITNHRIVEVRDGRVRFTYRDRQHGNRVETMTLDAHTFLQRFLLHVLPKGLVRIRHYGFLANRCKGRALRQCRQLCGQPPEPPIRALKTVAQWMQQLRGIDITRCPQCGARPLHRTPLSPSAGLQGPRSPPG
jgi:Putative transposase/Transposase zinc-binding domain